MTNKLGIIERIYLSWKAKNDGTKGLFQEVNVTDYIPAKLDITGDNRRQISPFIFTELSSFEAQRNALFNKKYYFIKFSNHRLRKLFKFSKAITKLDNAVVDLETNIFLLEKKCLNTMALLEQECSIRAENSAPEIIQLYEIKKNREQSSYLQQVNSNYSEIIEYLNQKILIMEDMKTKIKALLSYRYLRIRYYYEKSSLVAKKANPPFPTNDDLDNLCQATIMGEYDQILSATYKKRDEITSKIFANNVSIYHSLLEPSLAK